MLKTISRIYINFCFLGLLFSCNNESNHNALFTFVPSNKSHIEFENILPEDLDFNILNYLYYYNGGGVAVGDINNDGLDDVYFTSNMYSNKLYINQGGLKFKDITDISGVAGVGDWATGVTMVDINGDKLLDIYVCYLGDFEGKKGRNELYINNGDLTFTEKAEQYGLDFETFSTQAAFLDFDNDGDLDMYLLNHGIHTLASYAPRENILNQLDSLTGDRLLRNDSEKGQVKFVDVSRSSGIYSNPISFGLGIACADFNKDGWTDIYICNDFHENDYLYINNGDGTFSDQLSQRIGHTSKYSMGNDANDLNNDGWPDLVTLDMLPQKPEILQKSIIGDHYALRETILERGYDPQLTRNSLLLNNNGQFSDVACFAGIEATDWSWAPLIADLDNDGNKDLYITNGIYRRPNDLDFINYTSNTAIKAVLNSKTESITPKLISLMPQVPISNVAYKNLGNQRFEDVTDLWGLQKLMYSNGVAYSDLDNDGDLDLIVNNINEKASIIKNNSNELHSENHFIKINLHGKALNTKGVGAKLYVKHADSILYQEQNPVRGFLSSVSNSLNFGLGQIRSIDSIIVVWPGGAFEKIENVNTNNTLDLYEYKAFGNYQSKNKNSLPNQFFSSSKIQPLYTHQENIFHDPYVQFLIPRLVSREGPGLCVGDVNSDGLEDFYISGAKNQEGVLFIQNKNGEFLKSEQKVFKSDRYKEEVDAVFFDADNDKDLDLYIVTAGNEEQLKQSSMDSFYCNDGNGNFTNCQNFQGADGQNSTIAVIDFDKDGDLDFFVGGRVNNGNYGSTPQSYLFINKGLGDYKKLPLKDLNDVGMVTKAIWADLDGDSWVELILVGEWMPITIFSNKNGRLEKWNDPEGFKATSGWWNTIIADDFDNDGDIDMVAGNVGLNIEINASVEKPMRLYLKDFDENGKVDPIITHFIGDKEYPLAEKDVLARQLTMIKSKFPDYKSFAGTTIEELFTKQELEGANILEVSELSSVYVENVGNGKFNIKPLPIEANYAPLNSLISVDLNEDGYMDLIGGGNFYHFTPPIGRQDASFGFVGINDKHGNFISIDHTQSGLLINGEVRDLAWIKLKSGNKLLLAARNNDEIKVFELNKNSSNNSNKN